jgi:hypothetical protein
MLFFLSLGSLPVCYGSDQPSAVNIRRGWFRPGILAFVHFVYIRFDQFHRKCPHQSNKTRIFPAFFKTRPLWEKSNSKIQSPKKPRRAELELKSPIATLPA